MNSSVEYLIYIGLHDVQSDDEIVTEQEFTDMVTSFFERNEIDFTILKARGGYMYDEGHFITESTMCIDIIGDSKIDILRLTRNLSMYLNQERALIVKSPLEAMYC